MSFPISRRIFAPVVLLLTLLLAGCAAEVDSGVAEQEQVPLSLPAGEDGLQTGDVGATPPLGASMGSSASTLPERIELPSLGVETDVTKIGWRPVEQPDGTVASEWEVASFAAGWHLNSALPGQGGNVVLSGHNNIDGAVFRTLYRLQPGDVAYVYAGGQEFGYEVEEVMILEEKFAPIEQRLENARWIQDFGDERLTLVSCWPEDDNTHRVVVVAKPVDKVSSNE